MRINLRNVKCLSLVRKFEADNVISRLCLRNLTNNAATSTEGEGMPQPPLFDLHGRKHDYLRISLTERCNLRCQYCMPPGGAPLSAKEALLTRAELSRLLRVFVRLGVTRVRLTGGEPTLRPDLAGIIEEAVSCGVRSVGMTTNGVALTRQLPALQRAGLAGLNVSLDSLRPERYERMARRPALPRVLAGIDLALQLGYAPLKINVVLMKGFNDDEIFDFVEMTRDREIEVRFIEFMPFSGNAWEADRLVPYRAALRLLAARYELRPLEGEVTATAVRWQAAGHRGAVGFIASMTRPFCGGCNRLRLTADGSLKVCLFGAAEVSLRDAMRAGAADADLARLVRAALRNKKPQHAGTGKGHALAAAELAGALAAKRAADLIPLCHPLPLDVARVRVRLPTHVPADDDARVTVRIDCEVRVTGRTGAEMEALTGCAVAALTLYDMVKAADRGLALRSLRLLAKRGGRSGVWAAPEDPEDPDRLYCLDDPDRET